jgi:hypothetical protein
MAILLSLIWYNVVVGGIPIPEFFDRQRRHSSAGDGGAGDQCCGCEACWTHNFLPFAG